jgi:hypothetical protein
VNLAGAAENHELAECTEESQAEILERDCYMANGKQRAKQKSPSRRNQSRETKTDAKESRARVSQDKIAPKRNQHRGKIHSPGESCVREEENQCGKTDIAHWGLSYGKTQHGPKTEQKPCRQLRPKNQNETSDLDTTSSH